ncbi:MAG: TolC family protein [Parabacteroides sp.]|nr:TolC family protein [Parabacteroides sp.]
MKYILTIVLLGFMNMNLLSQITLQQCCSLARENYPLAKQYDLISLSEQYTLANIKSGNYPQLQLSGSVSYQSDVTTLPFDIPNLDFHGQPKDQYRVIIELRQNIWDGGEKANSKRNARLVAEENKRKLDISMHELEDRVNNIFFGILLLDAQLNQNSLLEENLRSSLSCVETLRNNGIVGQSEVDAVKVEILGVRQKRAVLQSSRASYIDMLSLLIGKKMDEKDSFVRPEMLASAEEVDFQRPELLWYDARMRTVENEMQKLKTLYMPRFSLFAQGGYGNPGLNMLEDKFRPYYIVGARLNWNISSLYTLKNSRKLLSEKAKSIDAERETFVVNNDFRKREKEGMMQALEKQLREDDEIIRLRGNIRKASEAKLSNGTISATDHIREINAESQAKQAKDIHEIEYLMRIYEFLRL